MAGNPFVLGNRSGGGSGFGRKQPAGSTSAGGVNVDTGEAFDTAGGFLNFIGQQTTFNNVSGFGISRARGGLRGLVGEGFRVGAENDRRFREASARLTGAVDNLAPTISDEDFNNLFAQEASRGVGEFEGNLDLINESIGIRGVSGGVAASLAVDAHAQFQQSLASAKGNVRVAKIQADAADAMRNLNAEFSLGNFLSQPADETRLATIAAFAEGEAGLAGLTAQSDQISKASANAKRAALFSLLGAGGQAVGAAI